MAEVVLPQVQQGNRFGSIHIANFVPKPSTGKPSLAKRGCRKGTKMNTYITGLEKKGGHRNLTGSRGRSPLEVVNTYVKIKYARVYKATYMAIYKKTCKILV